MADTTGRLTPTARLWRAVFPGELKDTGRSWASEANYPMVELILASSSPRRRELLAAAGYRFRIVPPGHQAECGVCSRESPPELVARLAYQKAADVVRRVDGGLVLGCDTVAECAAQILGKPADERHAREMLKLLSDREHRVYSGVCLWQAPDGEPEVEVERTTLTMRLLSPREIDEYLASGLWEGKAGAFGLQDRLGWLQISEGSESNVVGLPLERLAEMLARREQANKLLGPPPASR